MTMKAGPLAVLCSRHAQERNYLAFHAKCQVDQSQHCPFPGTAKTQNLIANAHQWKAAILLAPPWHCNMDTVEEGGLFSCLDPITWFPVYIVFVLLGFPREVGAQKQGQAKSSIH